MNAIKYKIFKEINDQTKELDSFTLPENMSLSHKLRKEIINEYTKANGVDALVVESEKETIFHSLYSSEVKELKEKYQNSIVEYAEYYIEMDEEVVIDKVKERLTENEEIVRMLKVKEDGERKQMYILITKDNGEFTNNASFIFVYIDSGFNLGIKEKIENNRIKIELVKEEGKHYLSSYGKCSLEFISEVDGEVENIIKEIQKRGC